MFCNPMIESDIAGMVIISFDQFTTLANELIFKDLINNYAER